MRQLLFTLGCIVFSMLTHAQGWRPFLTENQALFQVVTPFSHESPDLSFRTNEVIGIDIESLDTVGNEVRFYNYSMIGCTVENQNDFCDWEACTDTFSWIGEPLIYDNGWWSVNKWSDTILLPRWSSDTDTLLVLGDTSFVLTYDFPAHEVTYDTADSVKIGNLKVYVNGNVYNDSPWSGFSMQLSKNFGLMQTPLWSYFPRYLIKVEQVSIANRGLLGHYIGNYKVGDKLHYQSFDEAGDILYSNVNKFSYHVKKNKRCTVIAAELDIAKNEMHYELRRELTIRRGVFSEPTPNYEGNRLIGFTTESSIDTVSIVSKTVAVILNKQRPKAFVNASAVSIGGDTSLNFYSLTHGITSTLNCPIKLSIFEVWYESESRYQPRLGFKNNLIASVTDYNGDFRYAWEKLVYYKSGSYEYGSPLWPLGVESITQSEFSLFPNPVANILSIDGVLEGVGYSILNSAGVVMLEGQVGSAGIKVESLPTGIYLLRVEADGLETARFIKL